jgi:hypothetical protein
MDSMRVDLMIINIFAVLSPYRWKNDVYTDKKENQSFLIYWEIQSGAVAKSYEEGLPNI